LFNDKMVNNNQGDIDKTGQSSVSKLTNSVKPDIHDIREFMLGSVMFGVAAFDRNLNIITANREAMELLDIQGTIAYSLAAGTDEKLWSNWEALLSAVINDDKKSQFPHVRYSKGCKTRLLDLVCTPMHSDFCQKPIGGVLVIEDVSEKVEKEQQLGQTERLAAIGKIAGKVAHELNNPLDGILRYINLSVRHLENGNYEKPVEYLKQCRQGLNRMADIISELLEFSRSTSKGFEYVPVDVLINDAVGAIAAGTDNVSVSISEDCNGRIPRVKMGILYQVFCNLIKNAADAMDGRGKIEISIKCSEESLLVVFTDSGPGIDSNNIDVIFEPFFTTKPPGKGTGLGLAICKDLIEKQHGEIFASNHPDKGAVFTVRLPMEEGNFILPEGEGPEKGPGGI
jgi:signal transduction histidine kinase